MKKMTPKQALFIDAKAAGANNRTAAITAGYAPNSAGVAAAQLMARPDIQAAIKKAKTAAKRSGQSQDQMAAAMGVDNKEKPRLLDRYKTPLDFMLHSMNNPRLSDSLRFEAAKQAMPYAHARVGETGKKEGRDDEAKKTAKESKFRAMKPPPLRAIQGGKK